MQAQQPTLVIAVYMPCKGLHDNVDDFEDNLAQLHEIIQKYKNSHQILLGDFNESIISQKTTGRLISLTQFLRENQLTTKNTGKTYVGPMEQNSAPLTMYSTPEVLRKRFSTIKQLIDCLPANVSDHYPVLCTLNIQLDAAKPTSVSTLPPSKVKWEKVDKACYEEIVTEDVQNVWGGSTSLGALGAEICQLNQILVKASEQAGPVRVMRPRRAKLQTWTLEIKQAIQNKKKAFKEWKLANRPNDVGNTLLINKKLATFYLRRLCRVESAHCREQARQQILDAKSSDMKLFYRLGNKQRRKFINLTAKFSAWRQYFSTLATPTNNKDFDKDYRQQVASEMLDIMDICNFLPAQNPKDTVSELQVKEAIEAMNRGKSADIHGVTV